MAPRAYLSRNVAPAAATSRPRVIYVRHKQYIGSRRSTAGDQTGGTHRIRSLGTRYAAGPVSQSSAPDLPDFCVDLQRSKRKRKRLRPGSPFLTDTPGGATATHRWSLRGVCRRSRRRKTSARQPSPRATACFSLRLWGPDRLSSLRTHHAGTLGALPRLRPYVIRGLPRHEARVLLVSSSCSSEAGSRASRLAADPTRCTRTPPS